MGAHVNGHIEYREGGGWQHDRGLPFIRRGGTGHAHLFGFRNDYSHISQEQELAPGRGYPDDMSDGTTEALEVGRDYNPVTGEWFHPGYGKTHLTAADLDRLDCSLISEQWDDLLNRIKELGEKYGEENARVIVYFTV
jgi:hypothetical protein